MAKGIYPFERSANETSFAATDSDGVKWTIVYGVRERHEQGGDVKYDILMCECGWADYVSSSTDDKRAARWHVIKRHGLSGLD